MSLAAIQRFVDERVQADPAYAAELSAAGRPLLRAARELDDAELQARLEAIIGSVDRERLATLAEGHDSAESLAEKFLSERGEQLGPLEEDWLWVALTILWERWLPDRPSFETLDDWMQSGYSLAAGPGLAAGCDLWLQAWRAFSEMCERRGIGAVAELDARFRGSQSVFNWMQDLEMELSNAGLQDDEYLRRRIDVCGEILARFHDLDDLTSSNMKCAIAESFAELGDTTAADARFDELIRADPTDGNLWATWVQAFERSDSAKAAALVERALAVSGLHRRDDLLELAVGIGEQAGRDDLVDRARRELAESRPQHPPQLTGLPRAKKVGRNDPCPCGSGKKHKKCCLGSSAR